MTAKPETAAEVLAEMRQQTRDGWTSDGRLCQFAGRLERALSAQSPSYDALLLIAQSTVGALERAGVTDCDDPGEAIDVLREQWERKLSAQGEAVAWQCRRRNTVTGEWMEWRSCDSELKRDYYAQCPDGDAYEFRSLYTHPAPAAKPITRENEASLMLAIAEFIAASATPEDPRLAVADAISRHLGLGWPSASHPAPVRVTEEMKAEIEDVRKRLISAHVSAFMDGAGTPKNADSDRKFCKTAMVDAVSLIHDLTAALEDGRHG